MNECIHMRAGQEKNKNEDTEVMRSNLQWQLHLFVGLFVVQTYMSLFFLLTNLCVCSWVSFYTFWVSFDTFEYRTKKRCGAGCNGN
jgi:hypothetical protein